MNANQVKENYLETFKQIELGKSPLTHKKYSSDLKRFYDYFKLNDISDIEKITRDDYRNFIFSLTTLSNNSKNGIIRAISSFMKYLVTEEIIQHEVIRATMFGGKKFLPVKTEKTPPINAEEIKLIYSACNDYQERFMIAFMIYTGLRESSIVDVKISDINEFGLFRVKAKGDKLVPVKMSPPLMEMFETYKTQRDSSKEFLFYPTQGRGAKNEKLNPQSVYIRIKAILDRTDMSEERKAQITPHKFRHALVTKIYHDFSPEHARQVAHHSNAETTKIYNDDEYSLGLEAMNTVRFDLE